MTLYACGGRHVRVFVEVESLICIPVDPLWSYSFLI
jgi:hypothetical protein